MAIWLTQPVSYQPNLTLVRWRVFRSDRDENHFVGYCEENDEGRVSSAIQQFDPCTMRGVTQSGRVYQLSGPPGFDQDAMHVWAAWLRINRVPTSTDMTDNVWAEVAATVPAIADRH